jgi:hypothetical protein
LLSIDGFVDLVTDFNSLNKVLINWKVIAMDCTWRYAHNRNTAQEFQHLNL